MGWVDVTDIQTSEGKGFCSYVQERTAQYARVHTKTAILLYSSFFPMSFSSCQASILMVWYHVFVSDPLFSYCIDSVPRYLFLELV